MRTSGSSQSFSFEQFKMHLQGMTGGDRNEATAKAIVADVYKFFEDTPELAGSSQGSNTTANKLLNIQNIQKFYTTMKQEGKAATTIAEKLRRVKEAVRFIQLGLEESDSITHMRAQKVIDFISSHKMSNQIKLQRHKHALKMANKLPLIDDPYDVLKCKSLQAKVEQAILNLKKSYDKSNAKLLTAYCAAHILFPNTQRSGVIKNVKVQEFHQRYTNEKGKRVVQCADHKTGPEGPAQLVLNKSKDHLLEQYVNLVRTKIETKEGNEDLLFVTTNGSRYNQVFRKIKTELERTGIKNLRIPTPSEHRIVVGTESSGSMNEADYRVVAKHLGHSTATQRQYYEYATCDNALRAYHKIEELAKRRHWPANDNKILLTAWPLTNKVPPPLEVCVSLQQQLNMSRSTKNIVDKWRYLKNRED